MYAFLDIFFFVFHTGLILFSLLGWLWQRTRAANLVVLLLVAFSWFVLGIWYGFGFCPSTEWHWQVRIKLGDYSMPKSYIKFLVDSLTGLDTNAKLVDLVTVSFFMAALFASITANIRSWKKP